VRAPFPEKREVSLSCSFFVRVRVRETGEEGIFFALKIPKGENRRKKEEGVGTTEKRRTKKGRGTGSIGGGNSGGPLASKGIERHEGEPTGTAEGRGLTDATDQPLSGKGPSNGKWNFLETDDMGKRMQERPSLCNTRWEADGKIMLG